jgi:hypothetical protein
MLTSVLARNFCNSVINSLTFIRPRFGCELPSNSTRVESLRLEVYFIPGGQAVRNLQRKIARQSFEGLLIVPEALARYCTKWRVVARIEKTEHQAPVELKKFLHQFCCLFTGIVFLAQHSPVVGVFLMILGAPFWSVITINLGFVLMAKEARGGKLPRAW